jgi:hypothetical protein
LVRSGCGLALPLNPGAADVGGKAPNYPSLDRPGGQGGAGSLHASQDAGARCEGDKEENSPRASFDLRACAHRPLGVWASRAGRASNLARAWLRARVARCGSIRGGEEKG